MFTTLALVQFDSNQSIKKMASMISLSVVIFVAVAFCGKFIELSLQYRLKLILWLEFYKTVSRIWIFSLLFFSLLSVLFVYYLITLNQP